jgi:phosphate transport system substrate-binding protein
VHRQPRLLLAVLLAVLLVPGCSGGSSGGHGQPGASSTTISNKGSDTLVNLALAWAEAYHAAHPEVNISVTGGGTGTGIAALINGTVDIANASRPLKPEERQEAVANGVNPVEFVIARDAIAIVVNPENPVDRLTIDQLSDVYSGRIGNWAEVGGEDRPIVRLSREVNSGTHVFFLEHVVRRGDPNDHTLLIPETLLLPSSEGISAEIRQNPNAIGYDGLGYVTSDMKVVAVARDLAGPFVLPSAETVVSGTYPIARDLYMYTNGQPSPVLAAYLAWILGPEGQAIGSSLSFVPVNP